MFFLAAISLGFIGSFHCIGMCGPIAMSLPYVGQTRMGKVASVLLYNSGRIMTYGCIGLLFGLLGRGFTLAGWQDILSITLGVLVLFFLLMPRLAFFRRVESLWVEKSKLRTVVGKLFSRRTYSALFLIGVLNGLLPCGLVYMGLAGAMATGHSGSGSLFMIGFGLGTLPAMLAVGLAGNIISLPARMRIRKMMPVFVGVMAVMLILRGLNLGIPYLSPALKKTGNGQHYECCEK